MNVRCTYVVMCLVLLMSTTTVIAQPAQPFLVIVNSKNTMSTTDRKFISDVFLKKVTRWSDDRNIRPVDLQAKSSTRQKFSESILKRTVSEVKNYWQQRIFAGYDVPPPELQIDSEVIKFVATHSEAIGYVSGDADIGAVKVLIVN